MTVESGKDRQPGTLVPTIIYVATGIAIIAGGGFISYPGFVMAPEATLDVPLWDGIHHIDRADTQLYTAYAVVLLGFINYLSYLAKNRHK